MAVSNQKFTYPVMAGADLSAKQYHFVKLSAADTVTQATAVEAALYGVLENNPTSGRAAAVTVFGQTKITAGGSVTVNALITTNASGRATAAASGDFAMGRALEAATNDGDVISCMISPTRILV